jgi:gluconate 5-dehydrogenase
MSDLFSLKSKVALVTGGSRGLGRAMAEALAGAGAHVVLNGRDKAALDRAAADIAAKGGKASIAPFDVNDEAAVKRAMADLRAAHGGIDILFNNAGIVARGLIADSKSADWRRVIETDLTSLYVVAREAVAIMAGRGGGRIVNISSIMGLVGRPTVSSYITAKHGVIGLTRALAAEFGPQGINCNAIAPGYFATDINADVRKDEKFNAMVKARTPLGRWGDPRELGGAAVFLASAASSYVNGHILVVDGGVTATL